MSQVIRSLICIMMATKNWSIYGCITQVLHLTIGDNTGTVGDRTPALWIHKTRGVYIATALNGVASDAKFFKTKKPALNEWTRVEISQVKIGHKYFFSVAIKGEKLWFVENTRPKEFTDVMVFASSNWYAAQDGSIRHFEIENKVPGNDKRWHSHLNTSNLTHISVLMQDLSSWSEWSGCTKNRTQSTMACSITPESEDCQIYMERQDCVLTGELFRFENLCNRSSFCTSQHQSMVFIVHLYASMILLLTCRFQAKVNGRNGASGRLVPQLAWKVFQWEGGHVVLSHAKGTLLRLKPARRQTA